MNTHKTFWLIIVGMFIDQLGGMLVFPFFGLYITSKYNVGMTEVGVLFTIFAVTGVIGSFIGGALTDKFGRKGNHHIRFGHQRSKFFDVGFCTHP